VWKKAVPTALSQWAIDLRDHIASFPYGTVWTTTYSGELATARKDYHTWTYRKQPDGSVTLVTGICIPGITLYQPLATGVTPLVQPYVDPVGTPDPSIALYGVDPAAAKSSTDWPLVAVSGLAIVATVGLFALAVHHAGAAAASARAEEGGRQKWTVWWKDPEHGWQVYQAGLSRVRAERLALEVRTVMSPRWFGYNVPTEIRGDGAAR
jgi:hypothetical protein